MALKNIITQSIIIIVIISFAPSVCESEDSNLKQFLNGKLTSLHSKLKRITPRNYISDPLELRNILITGIDTFEVKDLDAEDGVIKNLDFTITQIDLSADYKIPPTQIFNLIPFYGEGEWKSKLKGISAHLKAEMHKNGSTYLIKEIHDVDILIDSAEVSLTGFMGNSLLSGIAGWILSRGIVPFANARLKAYLTDNRADVKSFINDFFSASIDKFDVNSYLRKQKNRSKKINTRKPAIKKSEEITKEELRKKQLPTSSFADA